MHWTPLLLALLAGAAVSHAKVVDLTVPDAQGDIKGALFVQYDPLATLIPGPTSAFLAMEHRGSETGANFAPVPTKKPPKPLPADQPANDTSVRVGDVPVVTIGGVDYWQFILDINELAGKKSKLSLNQLKLYVGDQPDIVNRNLRKQPLTLVYDMNAGRDRGWVKLDAALEPGAADMLAYIPVGTFGADPDKYLYMSSTFGCSFGSDGGAEIWSHGQVPEASPPGGGTQLPEPATMTALALGAAGLLARKRRCC